MCLFSTTMSFFQQKQAKYRFIINLSVFFSVGDGNETVCLDDKLQVRHLRQGWSRLGFLKKFVRLKEAERCPAPTTFSGLRFFLKEPQESLRLTTCLEEEINEIFLCQDSALGRRFSSS
jgi:hypothetical protein